MHHNRETYSSHLKPCVSFHQDDRSEAHFNVVVTVDVAVDVAVVVAVVTTVVEAVVTGVVVAVVVPELVRVLVAVVVAVLVAVVVCVVVGVVARRTSKMCFSSCRGGFELLFSGAPYKLVIRTMLSCSVTDAGNSTATVTFALIDDNRA